MTKPGLVVETPASTIDLMPTLIEGSQSDGISLRPLMVGKPLPDRDLFWHYPHYSKPRGKPASAIRLGEFKLIEFHETGRRELFDLKQDPSESHNLALEKPEIVAKLAGKLDAWKQQVGARMPTPNPGYLPNPPAADGSISMHARSAIVHGSMLRFEPLPNKDTLGFWVRADDWAEFEFTLQKAGKYHLDLLHGCGKGSGGSEVELAVGEQKLEFIVKETGGFQNFELRRIGDLTLEQPGLNKMTVKVKKKPGAAVMDLRQVILTPIK